MCTMTYESKKTALKQLLKSGVNNILSKHAHVAYTWVETRSALEELDALYLQSFEVTFGENIPGIFNGMDASMRNAGRHIIYGLRSYNKLCKPCIQDMVNYSLLMIEEQFNDFTDWIYSIQYVERSISRRNSRANSVNSGIYGGINGGINGGIDYII